MHERNTECLVTRTQRTALMEVEDGHRKTMVVECLERPYGVELGAPNVK